MPDKTEAEWEAESDANTLAEAEVIKADSKRFKAAQKAAGGLAVDAEVRAKGFRILEDNRSKAKKL